MVLSLTVMAPMSSFSDTELMELVKAGNQSAFSVLYDRHWGMLYAHCYKMLGNKAEAKDILQELFLQLWVKAAELDLKINIRGYLYIAARHKVLNEIRKRKNSDRFLTDLGEYMVCHENSVLDQINERELNAVIDAEIQKLPAKMREIFEYSRKKYLTHKEIADQLGISDQTVKKQVANAIKVLRLKLSIPFIAVLFSVLSSSK